MPRTRIALPKDLEKLALIEQSAASVFRDAGLSWIAEGETMDPANPAMMCQDGTLWVSVNNVDEPVGFVAAHELDGKFYITEVSVARSYQRQGIGAELIVTVIGYARSNGAPAVTLMTYRDLSWNAPFYYKLGFVEIDSMDAGLGHTEKLQAEAEAGHDLARRCIMARSIG
jgi:GNAT superfamily N-acetyltransferase